MADLARTRVLAGGFNLLALALACRASEKPAEADRVLVVYNAGSLALPLRTAFDSFAVEVIPLPMRLTSSDSFMVERGVTLQQESAGSLETARKLTELGKIPDIIALADVEIFPQLLVPRFATWYIPFARNRMVLAYRPTSRSAPQVDSTNWWRVLDREGVRVGRADPNQDPNGYRTLLTLQLTERLRRQPGLAKRLLARWGPRYIRPKEADLVALLQAGEVDYIWSYESIARAAQLPFVQLGDSVDLGNPADSAFYRTESVRVVGASRTDSLTITGAPILYALSIPTKAPHQELAARFVRYLVLRDGKRVLRTAHLDALDSVSLVGDYYNSNNPFIIADEAPSQKPPR